MANTTSLVHVLIAVFAATGATTGISNKAGAQDAPISPLASSEEYEEAYPDLLDGTLSAGGDLADDAIPKRGFFRFETNLGPWFQFKKNLQEEYGLTIGGSYGILWQNYSSTLGGEENSAGHKFTLNISADILNRGAPDALTFDMAIEDRRQLGSDLSPLWAGFQTGSATATAATWGDFDLGITQAYIRQNLMGGRFQYTIGKIFAPNYVNAYPFFDDNRQFLNQSFSTSPTIPIPLRGFGMVAAVYPRNNFYITAGMYTPYSDDTGWTINDFFEKGDHFYHLEFGFTSLAQTGTPIQARGPMDANNFHITTWYRDELDDGSPRAKGVAFNANGMLNENMMGFLRGGWSDGWLIERNVAAGIGYRPPGAPSDLFGFALGWAKPASELLDSQYTAEMFYRFQVTPQFAVTPDIQLIVDPALNPTEDYVVAIGLWARLTF
ncbi:carbohydrate porin [Paracoccus sp. CPCC 101403]|uniref:Carbohydrate porin n=1 Tax=Paracoccus broussonetiae TaxID=3075834 RepID=A0ABU3EK60_9RHOB|nr:carbohydrate porin [Paracoccus sp. CPCC 101403]MDT1064635.1 carbohydrate porin [Paracoccus sp. CPCC 101403]